MKLISVQYMIIKYSKVHKYIICEEQNKWSERNVKLWSADASI